MAGPCNCEETLGSSYTIPPGPQGLGWLSGIGVPAASLGDNGEFYLDEATRKIYKKETGNWVLKSIIPSSLAWSNISIGLTNDNLALNPTATKWLMNPSLGNSTITGITTTSRVDGLEMILYNDDPTATFDVTLLNEDALSTNVNRFRIGQGALDLELAFHQAATFVYRDALSTASRWYLISTTGTFV